ncbi:MAG: ParB/RepB/Spo0J family partition protein [Planctomycetota bacterium]|nr:ParB/RepB/Spo0J family partition protein [Planctomycetota bacterium]
MPRKAKKPAAQETTALRAGAPPGWNLSLGTIESIPIDLIRPSPHNRVIDPGDASIDDLAASIKERGLLQPIAVRPMSHNGYEIIYGERRWLACRQLGWENIKAIVRDVDEQNAQADRITENLMHRDLSPLEEGDGVAALLALHGGDVSEVANRLGRSETWVRRRAKLPNLSPKWREELAKVDTDYPHVRDSIERLEDLAMLPADVQDGLIETGSLKYADGAKDYRDTIARTLHRLDQRPWPEEYEDNLPPGEFPSGTRYCVTCRERSDRHGDLFAALAKDDESGDPAKVFCLNKQCWEAKTIAYVKALLINDPKAVPLQSGSWPTPSKAEMIALTEALEVAHIYNNWRICHDDDAPGLEEHGYERCQGVIVNGNDVGRVLDVWARRKEPEAAGDKTSKEKREREQKESERKIRQKEVAFHAVMKKMLPLEVPAVLTAEKMPPLAYNWASYYTPKEELRNANPTKILQELWNCVRRRLSQDVYYVNTPTPAEERKAVCEYCGLDSEAVEAAIKAKIAKANAAKGKKAKKAKGKKGKPAKPKGGEEEEGAEDGEDDDEDEAAP